MKTAKVLAGSALAAVGLVALAGPAMAAEPTPVPVTKLPANVTITTAQYVSVNVPNAAVCATGVTQQAAFVPGKQDAVIPRTDLMGWGCSAGQFNLAVYPNPKSAKKNAVVKITGVDASGQKVVSTLVVHVAKASSNGNGKGHGNGNS